MFHKIYILFLFLLPGQLLAQTTAWDRWDPEVVGELHTAVNSEFLNEEEKKVILFVNMARHDGPLFEDTFLKAYLLDTSVEMSKYVKSLIRDLKKTSNLQPLLLEEDLTSIAQGHATKTGKTGRVGHQGFEKRFDPFMGNPYNQVGENCSYGYDKAIDIVLALLIDEGVTDVGHRKNMLNEDFNSAGVAIRPHKSYRVGCVIDFGRQTRSTLNEIPY